jgi:hypothetical protein
MKQYPLIGGSICAVVLLVLGSLTNVVGFQTVQSSNQKVINDTVDQKKLLFQTIIDITNNKEIQKVILNSEIRREGFFTLGGKFSKGPSQVFTKDTLNRMYLIGLMFSKIISKSRIRSIVERYQVIHQEMQKKISATIEKNATINEEITQLSNLRCGCGNENTSWNFPVICILLTPILDLIQSIQGIAELLFHFDPLFFDFLMGIMIIIGSILNCFWIYR